MYHAIFAPFRENTALILTNVVSRDAQSYYIYSLSFFITLDNDIIYGVFGNQKVLQSGYANRTLAPLAALIQPYSSNITWP